MAGPLVALSTIVAESLDYIATELEKAAGGDAGKLPGAAQKILQEIITKHGAVIFNGDNYTAEWHAEAEKRGLPNLKTCVDALPVLAKPEIADLLNKYGGLGGQWWVRHDENKRLRDSGRPRTRFRKPAGRYLALIRQSLAGVGQRAGEPHMRDERSDGCSRVGDWPMLLAKCEAGCRGGRSTCCSACAEQSAWLWAGRSVLGVSGPGRFAF